MSKATMLAMAALAIFISSCRDKETMTTTTKEITETDTVNGNLHVETTTAVSSTKKSDSGEVTIATGKVERDTVELNNAD